MLKLLLPVLFPAWRFFSGIGASPRIQYGFMASAQDEPSRWHDFRPLPEALGVKRALSRLFFNPEWNETLYINTCAEHLFESYSAEREQEIMRRILVAIERDNLPRPTDSPYLAFRIRAVMREGQVLSQPVAFISAPVHL